MAKFGRVYKLTIFPTLQEVTASNGTKSFIQDPTTLTYTVQNPTTIEFAIIRGNLSSAASATFRIFNLGQPTREAIYKDRFDPKKYRQVKLEAGYLGSPLSIIFNGIIREAKSYRTEGSVNFITEIDAYDLGGYAMVNSISNIPPFPGVSKQSIISQLIKDLSVYNIQAGVIGQFPGTYPRGRVYGAFPTWKALRLETAGNCFMDNGKINCMNLTDVFEGGVPVLNSQTGLLSTPQRQETLIIADVLFEPGIIIGQKIDLESRTLPRWNGVYKVTGLQHNGIISDAVNGKCKTTVTLYNLQNNFVVLNNPG